MVRPFEAIYGLVDALRRVDVAGRTDRIIMRDALAGAGLGFDEDRLDEFRRVYCAFLREELPRDVPAQVKGALPGVRRLLDALAERDDVTLALLTGNFRESAEIKLAHFDLWRYFLGGAFGEDAFERPALLPVALQRHGERGGPIDASDVLVIGDTPHDIHCARAGGARVVAVATGNYDRASLLAHDPDALFDDLSDVDAFMRAI
jgi:phosphoglycolate phosphatase-like HAD superfamily hydrolase